MDEAAQRDKTYVIGVDKDSVAFDGTEFALLLMFCLPDVSSPFFSLHSAVRLVKNAFGSQEIRNSKTVLKSEWK
jgi:hypothetical protein